MQKRTFSPAFSALVFTLICIGVAVFLHHKKDRELIDLNESKSKLTDDGVVKKASNLKELIKKNLLKQEAAEIPDPALADVLTRERTYTELEINEMTERQFTDLLKDTLRKLPKKSDLKQLPPGALHRTPAIVIQAGRDLGVIKEVLKVHESYERAATPFYKTCAKDETGVTPVRALCLTNLIEIRKKNNEDLNLKEFPNQLVELSKMVTEI
jgi:hypothetical protein